MVRPFLFPLLFEERERVRSEFQGYSSSTFTLTLSPPQRLAERRRIRIGRLFGC